MSTTIDQRVVEMRFDNKQFESNVQTSMSTLEKLKQKLNLTGASKGLENLNSAASKVNMGGLGSAIETVSVKFSAMQIAGVTALVRIANQAITTGERMLSALTIDPIKTGFQEYETQMNAVQTILANTQSKGSTLDDVNKALDALNTYADKTIYNFTEMTRNIGTFTAAGVDLQTSVDSIQGIANLAAVSGSTSQQASTAMYQLSQALAAGKVSLMDWNSVVNAGMGGELFQNALLRTSELLKTGGKEAVATYGSFRESLTKGEWLTKEVLTETLKQLSGAYTEADLIAQGFTSEQAKEITALAKTATDAATKVKTFTQLWDVMKESAQSGWSQTWKLIVGDFEQAKLLLTPLADFFTGVIGKMSDARNNLLEGALGKGISKVATSFDRIRDVLDGAKKGIDDVTKPIKVASKSLEELGNVADKVISGAFGNGEDRFKALTEAGENYYRVQNKVNEKLGNSFRYTEEQIAAQDKVIGKQKETVEGIKEQEKATGELTKSEKARLAALANKSEAELKSLGYNEKQIETLKEIKTQADKLGMSTKDFVNNLDEINGRWLFWNSFKNIGMSIVTIFSSIGKAWRDAFPPMQSEQLYNIIAGFHKFSTKLVISEETANNLTRTFKGLFAVIGIVSDILGGGFKIAFKAISAILSYFDTDLLSVTAALGDILVAFRKATDISALFEKAIGFIVPLLQSGAKAIAGWADSFAQLPKVKQIIDRITTAFEELKNIDFKEFGKNIINGLIKGMDGGAMEAVKKIIQLGIDLIVGFCTTLGIFSPSREFYTFGENITQGLTNGIQNGFSKVSEVVKGLGTKIKEVFGNIDFGTIFAGGIGIGSLTVMYKLASAIDSIASPLGGLGDVFDSTAEVMAASKKGIAKTILNFSKVVKSFSKVMNSFAHEKNAKAMLKVAGAVAILAASIYLLTTIDDPGKLWGAIAAIGVLSAILVGLSFALDKMSKASVGIGKDGINIDGLKSSLVSIGVTLLMLAATVKIMGSMTPGELIKGFTGIAGAIIAIGLVFAAFGLLDKFASTNNLDKVGSMVLKVSFALLLLVGVAKLASKLTNDEMLQAAKFAGGFAVFVAALCGASLLAGKNIDKVGGMVLKVSFAMLLMIGVTKLASKLTNDEMLQAAKFAGGFVVFLAVLMKITKIGKDKEIAKLGGLLLSISLSMILMVGLCKLINLLEPGEMGKAALFAAGFLSFVFALTKITTISNDKQMAKVAGTILAASLAVGILAGVAIILGLISLPALAKGVVAVTILGAVMTGMIWATRGASECKGNLIAMSVAIGIMAAAIVVLSFIKPEKLAGATLALTTVMGMFALIISSSANMTKAIGPLIVMTVAIGILTTAIILLSKLPIESTLASAAALSMLLLSMSASMAIIGKFGSSSLTGIVSLGLMTVVVGLIAGILYLIQDLPIESTMNNVKAISLMLLSMSGVLAILTVIGLGGPAAAIGIASLAGLIVGIGGIITAIGALATEFPRLEEFLNTGIPILESIGYALGSFFGNIISGFAESATASLPNVGTNLSNFMTNLEGFISGAKSIDEQALTGVSNLAKMMLLVAGASIVDKISSLFGGGSSMATFSSSLDSFADAIVSFSTKVKGNIDETSVLAAANAGKIMAEMQSSLSGTGGVIQWFAGEKNIAAFGEQLLAYGDAIVGFSNKVSGEGAINETAVLAAANAGKIMAEMQGSLASTGGVIQWFAGEKDMAAFGQQLVAYGEAIVGFSSKVSAEGAINETAVLAAANAGKIMTEIQSNLVSTGGVIQWFSGEKDMATFGMQLKLFGDALVAFSSAVSGNIDEGAIVAAANAGNVMANVQRAIPEDKWFDGKISLDDFGKKIVAFGVKLSEYSEKVSGIDILSVMNSTTAATTIASLAQSLVGIDTAVIDNFKIVKIASSLKDYHSKVADIEYDSISNSISISNRLASFVRSLAGIDTSGVELFKKSITDLGSIKIGNFSKTFGEAASKMATIGSEIASSLVKGINSKQSTLITAGATLANNVAVGFDKNKTRIITVANATITSMMNTIKVKAPTFTTLGVLIGTNLTNGIKRSSIMISTAFTEALSSSITTIRSYYSNFYSAGSYLADGFAKGIEENDFKAASKAAAMATAAKEAAERALKIKSPSKVFYEIGSFAGKGLINSLNDYSSKTFVAGYDMAESAKNGLAKAITRINDIISGKIDSQPTIRPVLDLSGVSAGAGVLSSMLDANPSVGVMANIRSISSMRSNSQNGGNEDVISAIKDLKSSLNGLTGNTYHIDGITYDNGSEISNAVETLIRAATIERRA